MVLGPHDIVIHAAHSMSVCKAALFGKGFQLHAQCTRVLQECAQGVWGELSISSTKLGRQCLSMTSEALRQMTVIDLLRPACW